MTRDRTRGKGWSCVYVGSQEKVLPLWVKVLGTAQGMGRAPRLPGLQGVWTALPGTEGDCWGVCAGQGVGLDDPCASFPVQDILILCSSGGF